MAIGITNELKYIPYGRHDITEADIKAVVEVLRSDWLTQGPMVPKFEQAIAKNCGAARGVAVNSATSALHIACLALGLGPGDWLWTSPITFVASANCGRYCGADVDFVDIDPRTYTLCPVALAEKLREAEKTGRLPKVVVPVHLTGQSCDGTSIVKEYPCSTGEPYYPIPRPENAELYKRYQSLATEESNVFFVGRLAQYRYYNMDQAVAAALSLSGKILDKS